MSWLMLMNIRNIILSYEKRLFVVLVSNFEELMSYKDQHTVSRKHLLVSSRRACIWDVNSEAQLEKVQLVCIRD